jgi:HEPN domain-containing protein
LEDGRESPEHLIGLMPSLYRLKEHTRTLLETAKDDLEAAKSLLPWNQPFSAYCAQQCTEVSLKAAAFELGPYLSSEDFEEIAHDISHNSSKACLKVLLSEVMEGFEKSQLQQKVNQDVEDFFKNFDIGHLIAAQIGQSFVDGYVGFISRMGDNPILEGRRFWLDSLRPDLEPSGIVNEGWLVKTQPHIAKVSTYWKTALAALGIKNERLGGLMEADLSREELIQLLSSMPDELRSEGKPELAKAFEDGLGQVKLAFGPNFEMVEWLQASVPWVPYIDAHVSIGRYPTADQKRIYKENQAGVANLIRKSEMILEETSKLLSVLAPT